MEVVAMHNISKSYTIKDSKTHKKMQKDALKDVSFSIHKGEFVGLLGPNGAGKTTIMKILSGILNPSAGEAKVFGYIPWKRDNNFKKRISIVLGQKNQLWWDLPASESLFLNKHIYKIQDSDYDKTLDELTELLSVKELLSTPVRNLSLGERMKFELIAALLHKPDILFLDEPTIGLDMIAQKNMRQFLKYYNEQEKTTVLLTSHYLTDIEELCERTIIINHGSVCYDGDINDINQDISTRTIIGVKTDEDASNYNTDICKFKEKSDDTYFFEIQKMNVNRAISELLLRFKINDISIKSISLEAVLEKFYRG